MLKKHYILLIIITLAIALRVYNLGKYCYWFDEKLSITNAYGLAHSDVYKNETFTTAELWNSKNTLSPARACVEDDSGNGVLHTYLVRGWVFLVGKNEFNSRFLELIIGIFSIILVYKFSKDFFNQKIAYLTAFLLAIHPFWVLHNQELRAYSLAVLLTLTATYCFYVLWKDNFMHCQKWKIWLIYTFLIPLCFLTHYLSLIIFISQGLICIFTKRNKILLLTIAAGGIGIALCSVWLWAYGLEGFEFMAKRNLNYVKMSAQNQAMQLSLTTILGGFMEMIQPFFGNLCKSAGFRLRELLILLLPFLIILLPFFNFWRLKTELYNRDKFTFLFILSISSFIMALLLAIQSGHIVSLTPRYALWNLPYFSMILAACLYYSLQFENQILKKIYWLSWIILAMVQFYSLTLVWADAEKNRETNGYEAIAVEIENKIKNKNKIEIYYNDSRDAILMNLYLDKNNGAIQKLVKKQNPTEKDAIFIYDLKLKTKKLFYTDFEKWAD